MTRFLPHFLSRHCVTLYLFGLAILVADLAQAVDSPTELIVQRGRLDDTVWEDEIEAQKYEKSIDTFWDELREAENPLELLRTYPLGRIERPNFSRTRRLTEKILEFVHRPAESRVFLKRYQIETGLANFEKEGFRLDQSEWKQVGFRKTEAGVAQSKVAFSIHASGPVPTLYRRIIVGTLSIDWQDVATEEELFEPVAIYFDEMKMYRRSAPSAFEERMWFESDEKSQPYGLAIAEDIDSDGWIDVVFPRLAKWYRNRGNFRFETKPLNKYPVRGSIDAAAMVDLDSDGSLEYVISVGNSGLFAYTLNRKTGAYDKKPKQIWKTKDRLFANSLAFGDTNGDGLPEIFIGQASPVYYGRGTFPNPYFDAQDGMPSYFLKNEGKLNFRDMSSKAKIEPVRNRRYANGAFVDLDGDNRMDFLMTGEYSGVDVLENDSKGAFDIRTEEWLDESHLFGSSFLLSDFNRDGVLDLFAAGVSSSVAERFENMALGREELPRIDAMRSKMSVGNRFYLGDANGGFSQSGSGSTSAKSGFARGLAGIDINNDSFEDVYLSNGYITGRTVSDYGSRFWRHDIYDGVEEKPEILSSYFTLFGPGALHHSTGLSWNGFQTNDLFLNLEGEGFIDAAYLFGLSHIGDGRALLAEDFDNDGQVDILAITQDANERVERVFMFENRFSPSRDWIGVQLMTQKKSTLPGTKVRLKTPDYETVKTYVIGNGYSSQSSSRLHFGLGRNSELTEIEILWPSGKVTTLTAPETNRYHSVSEN